MKRIIVVGLVFLMLMVGMAGFVNPSADAEKGNGDAEIRAASQSKSGLTSHDPIYINGNSNFTSENGVTSGNGTASNPYIIQNWDINASSANGINIWNTDVYFIIRNCVIHDGKSNFNYGIYFYNVQNGKIDNVTSHNNSYGIYFYADYSDIENNTIINCTIYNNSNGIYFYAYASWYPSSYSYIQNNNIYSNTIYSNSQNGIYFYSYASSYSSYSELSYSYIQNNNIYSNTIYSNSQSGIYFYAYSSSPTSSYSYSSYSYIQNNNIYSNAIYSNTQNGIYFYADSYAAYYPAYYSYAYSYIQNNNIYFNTIYSNSQNSIYLFSVSRSYSSSSSYIQNNNIYSNTIYSNSQSGIYFYSYSHVDSHASTYSYTQNNNIYSNRIYSNSQNGIYFYSYLSSPTASSTYSYSQNNNIYSNTIYSNSQSGIYFYTSAYYPYSSNNKITYNQIYNNSLYGIYLDHSSNNNLSTNQIYRNKCGIYLWYSSNNQIHYNNIYNNTWYGVYNEESEIEYQANATYNWWGSANGPGQDGANPVYGAVNYTSWLYEAVVINQPPTAHIDFISPNPAIVGQIVSFAGHGTDLDGSIVVYNWGSSIEGFLSNQTSFNITTLSVGRHIIYLKVQDNGSAWSSEVSVELVINPTNQPPVAYIDSISPNPAVQGASVTFTGHGTDPDGTIVAYNWSSSIDGQLSTLQSFSTSSLSVGTHMIYFKAKDDKGLWSNDDTETLVVMYQLNPVWYMTWSGGDINDCAQSIAVDNSNIYVVGWTNRHGASGGFGADAFVLKYDLNGNLLWTKTWGGGNNRDEAHSIAIDSSSIYVAGDTYNYSTWDTDAIVRKYDLNGNLLWSKTVGGGSTSDWASSIAVDNSNIYVAGETYTSGTEYYGAIVWKYDLNGNLLWTKTWSGGTLGDEYSIEAHSIVVDNSNIYVAGDTYSPVTDTTDVFVRKYDLNGNLLWTETWGSSSSTSDKACSIAVDNSNIYVAGWTVRYGADNTDAFVLKYDLNGNLLWTKTWGSSSTNDYSNSIAVDSSNIYVAGRTYSHGTDAGDAVVLKYDLNGNLLWAKSWGSGSTGDEASSIAVDSSNIYVAGYTNAVKGWEGWWDSDAFVLKCDLNGSGGTVNNLVSLEKNWREFIAKKFKPILLFDTNEKSRPVSVEYAFKHSNLVDGNKIVKKAKPISAEDLLSDYSNYYLDNPTVRIGDFPFYGDPTLLEQEYQNEATAYLPIVYVRVHNDTSTGSKITVIQYWLYYPINNGINDHEGDWELVQINLNAEGQPISVYMSIHEFPGWNIPWNSVWLSKEGDSPKVYVAKGSHANYYRSYSFTGFGDTTDGSKPLSDYTIITIDENNLPNWLDFPGRWGEANSTLPWWNGPTGPKFREVDGISMWNAPSDWAKMQPEGTIITLASKSHTMITDSQGRRLGYDGDDVISEIPNGTPIHVVKQAGDAEIEIYYVPTGAEYNLTIIGYETGTFNLSVEMRGSAEATIWTYENVSVKSTTKAILKIGPNVKDYLLKIDEDGDGIFEKSVEPTNIIRVKPLEIVTPAKPFEFPWLYTIIPVIIVVLAVAGIGIKRRKKALPPEKPT